MGKIQTRGFARKEVEYDRMKIRLDFYASEQTLAKAIRSVGADCENFLGRLEKLRIKKDTVRSAGDAVSHDMYTEKEQFRASRAIEFTADYSLALLDVLSETIADGEYRVDMNVIPILSKEAEIRDELIKEAIADARRSADLIAESTGTRVEGIETIKTDRYYDAAADAEERDAAFAGELSAAGAVRKRYADLKRPVTEQTAEIFIEWKIED